jgi:hypothetical protein
VVVIVGVGGEMAEGEAAAVNGFAGDAVADNAATSIGCCGDDWTGGVCNLPAATELYGIPGMAGGVWGRGEETELLALLT